MRHGTHALHPSAWKGFSQKFVSDDISRSVGRDLERLPAHDPTITPTLRALDINVCAVGARFPPGVHYASVPALAPVGRVQLVAVGHVDLVGAPAAAHHVGVRGVLVGQDQIASTLRDDLVVLSVADTLEDLV